jgi:hypothetical protein
MRTHIHSYSVPDRRRRKARQKIKKIFHIFLLCIGIPAVIAVGAYILFFSKFFAIERIDVSASGGIHPQDVRSVLFKNMDERRFFFIRNGNIFLFDKESALKDLRNFFAVDTVEIQKKFPSSLAVAISGKPFAALWCTSGFCYALYTDGTVSKQVDAIAMGVDFSKLPASFHGTSTGALLRAKKQRTRQLEIPLFIDEKNEAISQENTSLISPSALTIARDMFQRLTEKKIPIAYIRTHTQSADTTAVTQEGWDILFTPFEPADAQVENLQTVLFEKIKDKRKNLKYIDVRFQNHIYYTFR